MRCRLVCSLVVVVVDVLGLVPTVEGLSDNDSEVVAENRSSPSALWSELLQAWPPAAFLRVECVLSEGADAGCPKSGSMIRGLCCAFLHLLSRGPMRVASQPVRVGPTEGLPPRRELLHDEMHGGVSDVALMPMVTLRARVMAGARSAFSTLASVLASRPSGPSPIGPSPIRH